MTTYVALLRGINLGSRNKIAMSDLRELFERLGHGDVRTYIQSGNVVFTSNDKPVGIATELKKRIESDLGVAAAVLLRTKEDLDKVAAANPFVSPKADVANLHVTFLADVPGNKRAAQLTVPAGEPDELSLAGREVYLQCPNGYGRTKLNNAYIEKRLGVAATTRNWKTVTKLREMASA